MEEATRAEDSTLSSHGLDSQWNDFAQMFKAAELGNVAIDRADKTMNRFKFLKIEKNEETD